MWHPRGCLYPQFTKLGSRTTGRVPGKKPGLLIVLSSLLGDTGLTVEPISSPKFSRSSLLPWVHTLLGILYQTYKSCFRDGKFVDDMQSHVVLILFSASYSCPPTGPLHKLWLNCCPASFMPTHLSSLSSTTFDSKIFPNTQVNINVPSILRDWLYFQVHLWVCAHDCSVQKGRRCLRIPWS